MSLIRRVRCPVRIDISGGTLDIQPIPQDFGPVTIVAAAINKYVTGTIEDSNGKGLSVTYSLDSTLGTGSGLGTSGAMNLCWLALISGEESKYTLATRVYDMELATGVVGGVQDQFMSAFGGLRSIIMSNDRVWLPELLSENDAGVYVLPHLLLVDTHIARSATGMNKQFLDNYKSGCFYKEISDLIEISDDLCDRISKIQQYSKEDGYIRDIGILIDSEWTVRRKLMPARVEEIDNIILSLKKKYGSDVHAKVLGAAGGGCVLLWLDDSDMYGRVATTVETMNCSVIPFEFDYQGLVYESELTQGE
jgi:galactokinase/mevalonate kinase-like predicted kinase